MKNKIFYIGFLLLTSTLFSMEEKVTTILQSMNTEENTKQEKDHIFQIKRHLKKHDFKALASLIVKVQKKLRTRDWNDIDCCSILFIQLLLNDEHIAESEEDEILFLTNCLSEFTDEELTITYNAAWNIMLAYLKTEKFNISKEHKNSLNSPDLLKELIKFSHLPLINILYELHLVSKDNVQLAIQLYFISIFERFFTTIGYHFRNSMKIVNLLKDTLNANIAKNSTDHYELAETLLKELHPHSSLNLEADIKEMIYLSSIYKATFCSY